MNDPRLPHQGRWLRAPHRLFREVAVFVHHYGGNRASVKKHQEFLADLGFDSVAFTLSFPRFQVPFLKDARWGLRERWTNEITDILDAINEPKVVYSFSLPSALTAESLARRKARDTVAWITEGGPFVMPARSMWNYFKHYEGDSSLFKRGIKLALSVTSLELWDYTSDLHKALDRLPKSFPILSIRSWQDWLVPLSAIDQAFSRHSQLHLESLNLPEAGHIDGLVKFPAEYKPRIARFLNRYATRSEVDLSPMTDR